jgi:hypothetical protein
MNIKEKIEEVIGEITTVQNVTVGKDEATQECFDITKGVAIAFAKFYFNNRTKQDLSEEQLFDYWQEQYKPKQ